MRNDTTVPVATLMVPLPHPSVTPAIAWLDNTMMRGPQSKNDAMTTTKNAGSLQQNWQDIIETPPI